MAIRDLVTLFALGAIWGGSFLFIRIAAPVLGPFPLVTARIAIAALALALLLRLRRQPVRLRANVRGLLTLGALNAAVPFALIATAELHLTASMTAMLHATAPLWSVLLGSVWLGERITSSRAAGALLGLAGVGVIVGWSPMAPGPQTLLAALAVLTGTGLYVCSNIYTRRRLSHLDAPTLSLGQQLGALPWLAIPTGLTIDGARLTPAALLAVLVLGLVCTAAAYPLFFRLLARVGSTRTTTVTYIIPVFGALWGWLFLAEPLTAGMWIGLAMILASIALVNELRIRTLLGRATAP
jgi:drug/metabolite transporter (DMT)-like permease